MDPTENPVAKPIFFPVSVFKFGIMYVATFGLYQIFWAFKSWLYFQSVGHRVSPGARAWFSFFYLHSLLGEILQTGKAVGLSKAFSPTIVFIPWLLLQLSGRLPAALWIISLLGFVPLISVLNYVNQINRATGKGDLIDSKLSIGNWLGLIIGIPLLLIAVVASFSPDK